MRPGQYRDHASLREVVREKPVALRGCREYVVVGVVEAECPADGFACGARGWRHAEEVAAVAAVWLGGRVDDLHEVDVLAVDPDSGRPQLAVVVLRKRSQPSRSTATRRSSWLSIRATMSAVS